MAGMSDYLEQNLLDWFFRRATWDPGDPKVKLYQTGPTDVDAGTGTELTGATNYTAGGNTATRGTTNWQVVTSTNGMALQNKIATGPFSWTAGNDWPAVTGAAITTSTGTFMWGNTMTTRDGNTSDTLRFAVGAIDLKLDATTSAGVTTEVKTAMLSHLGIGSQDAARPPATAYVALYTSATALNLMTGASGTEVSGNAYARLAVTSASIWHAAASSGTGYHIHNTAMNGWSAANPSAWGAIRYAALVDTSAGAIGHYYACDQLASDVQIDAGDTFSIAADAWLISLDEAN